MAAEVHQFSATIPAGTPKSSLAVVNLPLTYYDVESIDLEVPPGPAGLMGFYLALSGQQWLPFEAGQFLIWDDRFASWALTEQPTSYGWELHGYNTDVYDHTVTVRFHLNVPASPLIVASAPTLTIVQGIAPGQQLVTL